MCKQNRVQKKARFSKNSSFLLSGILSFFSKLAEIWLKYVRTRNIEMSKYLYLSYKYLNVNVNVRILNLKVKMKKK